MVSALYQRFEDVWETGLPDRNDRVGFEMGDQLCAGSITHQYLS
jgi:hypothetical protein